MQTNDSLCKSSLFGFPACQLNTFMSQDKLQCIIHQYHDLRSHSKQNYYFHVLKAVSHLTALNKSTEKRTVCSSVGFCFQDKYFA